MESGTNYEKFADEICWKTAVIFPQDTPACRFQQMLRKEKIHHVYVSGFDNYTETKGSFSIFSIEPDFELWAKETLRLLQTNQLTVNQIVRIPGRLIIP